MMDVREGCRDVPTARCTDYSRLQTWSKPLSRLKYALFLVVCLFSANLFAESRFPKPDFEKTGHTIPTVTYPNPPVVFKDYLDLVLLALALAVTAWAVHRKRSRAWVFGIMIACLAYFGFYKKGCICPIGSTQNMALALGGNGYAVPLAVIGVFLLPLIFALVFGRVFCATVCPLGAVQDCFVVKRPLKLPNWLIEGLSLIPYVYLAFTILLAATGTSFIICRFDPFVALFRLSGSSGMLIFAGIMIALGVFVARPYCRFLCPYGVLLGWVSTFTIFKVKITPSSCIQCKLCEDSCPVDVIDVPMEKEPKARAAKLLKTWLFLTPVLVVLGAVAGWYAGTPLARLNKNVQLSERIEGINRGNDALRNDETEAFLSSGARTDDLLTHVVLTRRKFRWGTAIALGFVGLVIGLRLIRLTVLRNHVDYEPDQSRCIACARCFSYCPVDPGDDPSESR